MNVISPARGFVNRRDISVDSESPRVVLDDVIARPRPRAKVITVANEKGGVGKSTIAFHLAVALASRGFAVAAIDLDRRQQTFSRVLTNRAGTARRLGIGLPQPRHQLLGQHSGAMLCQEISRIGWDCDYVVIDAPGYDSGIARRAIAIADRVVTPVNSSFVDLDLLGRFHPVDNRLLGPGCFSEMLTELRAARIEAGHPDFDWLVLQNRKRGEASRNRELVDGALARMAKRFGFRLGAGLSERVAYRDLFQLGLTHFDLKLIPRFARRQSAATDEVLTLVEDLGLERDKVVEASFV